MCLLCTPILVIVLVWSSCTAKSDTDNNGYGNLEYTNFLTDLVRAAKRSVVTDHGYGSRVNAATKVADALTMYDTIYGVYGPGKRSVIDREYSVTPSDGDGIIREFPKRRFTDLGYGTRVAAGKKIADAKLVEDDIFGDIGPGKRSTEGDPSAKMFYHVRNGEVSDTGYSSRIDAAKLIARDIDTGYNIFGHIGPGKRR